MQSHGTTPNIAAQAIKSTTRHGFLVALGWVAQRLNLVEILNRHLRIKQKTYAQRRLTRWSRRWLPFSATVAT
jgi:hypothetical protein